MFKGFVFLRYSMARDRAITQENIESGFRKAGLCPLLTADAWLEAYGEEHNIVMNTTPFEFITKRQNQIRECPPTPSIDALDLHNYVPKSRNALPVPILHRKKKKKTKIKYSW